MVVYGEPFKNVQENFELKSITELRRMSVYELLEYFWQHPRGLKDCWESPDMGLTSVSIKYYKGKCKQKDDMFKCKILTFCVQRKYKYLADYALRDKKQDTQKTQIKLFIEDLYGNRKYIVNTETEGYVL